MSQEIHLEPDRQIEAKAYKVIHQEYSSKAGNKRDIFKEKFLKYEKEDHLKRDCPKNKNNRKEEATFLSMLL